MRASTPWRPTKTRNIHATSTRPRRCRPCPSKFEDLYNLMVERRAIQRLLSDLQKSDEPDDQLKHILKTHKDMVSYAIRRHTGVATEFFTKLASFHKHTRSDRCAEMAECFYRGTELSEPHSSFSEDDPAREEQESLVKKLSSRSKSVHSTNLVRLSFSRGHIADSARQLIYNPSLTGPERRHMTQELTLEMNGKLLYDIFSRILPGKFMAKSPDSSVLQEIGDRYDTVLHEVSPEAPGTSLLVRPFVAAWTAAELARGRLIARSDRDTLSDGLKEYVNKLTESEKRTEHLLGEVWCHMTDESFYQPKIKKDTTPNKTAKSGEMTQNSAGLTMAQTPGSTSDSRARSCTRNG